MLHLVIKHSSIHSVKPYKGHPMWLGLPQWHSGKESTCNAGDLGLIPGSGRSPGEENGNPLQYSGLENPMDRSLVGYRPGGHKRVRHNLVTKQQQCAGGYEVMGRETQEGLLN